MDITPIIAWLAPIMAALVQASGLAVIAHMQKSADDKRESARADTKAKREAEADWRDSVDERLSKLAESLGNVDDKVNQLTTMQATDARTDIVAIAAFRQKGV